MRIYAPVKNATGTWCGVQFKNGFGETDNPRLIEWFREHGYKVESPVTLDDESTLTQVLTEAKEVDEFESMTPNELRDWMKANGYGSKMKNIRNKDKLLEIIRG